MSHRHAADDTDVLADLLREAKSSPRKRYRPGEFRRLAKAFAAKRRQPKTA